MFEKSKMSLSCILFFIWFVTTVNRALGYVHTCPDKNITAVKVCENGNQTKGVSLYLVFEGGNLDQTETCYCNLSIEPSTINPFDIEPLFKNTSGIRLEINNVSINKPGPVYNLQQCEIKIMLDEVRDSTCIAEVFMASTTSSIVLQCFMPDKTSFSSTYSTKISQTGSSTHSTRISNPGSSTHSARISNTGLSTISTITSNTGLSTHSTRTSQTGLPTISIITSKTASVNTNPTTIKTFTASEDASTGITVSKISIQTTNGTGKEGHFRGTDTYIYVIAGSASGVTVIAVGVVICVACIRRRMSHKNMKPKTNTNTDVDAYYEMTVNTAYVSVDEIEGREKLKDQSNKIPSEIDEYAVVGKNGQIIANGATSESTDPIYNHLHDQYCEINDNGNIYDKTENTSSCVYDHTNSVTSRVKYEDNYDAIKYRVQKSESCDDDENIYDPTGKY